MQYVTAYMVVMRTIESYLWTVICTVYAGSVQSLTIPRYRMKLAASPLWHMLASIVCPDV